MENPFKFVISRKHFNDEITVSDVWQTLPPFEMENSFPYKAQCAQGVGALLIRFLDEHGNIVRGAGIAVEINE
jgi:hypothetical protein